MLILRASNLDLSGIAHGFFGRRGGVSEGIYASLNCGPGSGDDQTRIAENRNRVLHALADGTPADLVTLAQIHSAETVTVTEPWVMGSAPKADAMVTNRADIALGILAADCAPVLLADPEAHVIGAAHAGWGGAFGGVLENVVSAMARLGAERTRIVAAVGPCIGQASYEVGPEFEERFAARDPAARRFFVPAPRQGHWQFDLEAYVAARLEEAGIGTVKRLGADTYTREADFFSFRRTTHQKQTDYGRQISAILLHQ